MKQKCILCLLTGMLAVLSSCSVLVRMEARALHRDSTSISLMLPAGNSADIDDSMSAEWDDSPDTLTVMGPEGKRLVFIKATMDSSGTIHMTEPLREVVITARFKNIPERNGHVHLAFDISVPAPMLSHQWQVRLVPSAVVQEDSLVLEAVHITGANYLARQIRGYQLYKRFIAGIITDPSMLVDIAQLEIFIRRNIPQIAAFKNDTAFVDISAVRGFYGISLAEAKEHFRRKGMINRNNRRLNRTESRFRQLVKDPFITEGIRLDTVLNSCENNFLYNYTQDLSTRPGLRKIDISLKGGIFYQGEKIYDIPPAAPLTFYVSSFATMTEDIVRYVTKVVERRVEFNTSAAVNFKAGKADIDSTYMGNKAELEHIQSIITELISTGEYVADSLIITASCSPEGSYALNSSLASRRAKAISGYLDGKGFKLIERYIPEHWERLERLIMTDTAVKDKAGILRILGKKHPDRRERQLSTHPEYSYLRNALYPLLREVEFDFCLHRRDMVKDTIHTTEPDTLYAAGVLALKDSEYAKAVRILGGYRDINSALAFLAMDYNASAANILEDLPISAKRDYLLAVVYSRTGNDKKAVEYYLSAVHQDRSMSFRGNLDPEIRRLIEKYKITIN